MQVISFARGIPAPELLPLEALADCASAAIQRDGATILNYGPVSGYRPLREWIARRHDVEPNRVLVTNGSLQAFVLLAACLARGRRVLVEGPTYDRPLKILGALGAAVEAVPIDGDGLELDALERMLDGGEAPAFLYTIPTFQNPTGRSLRGDRRARLVALAAERGLLVVEDDPYRLVRFEGDDEPSLFELAGGEGVVYSSSFSKIVAPGIRVGYLVLPTKLVDEVSALATAMYITPSLIGQATVHEFLRRGLLGPALERVRSLLRLRRDAMLASLEREVGEAARWTRPAGGYFLWLELPEEVDADVLLARAEAAGVAFVRGCDFFPGRGGGEHAARLAYSFVSPDGIAEGIGRLAALLPAAAAV